MAVIEVSIPSHFSVAPMYFALATLKTPGGGAPGIKAARGHNGGLTMRTVCMELMLLVPDDGGSGVSGVSVQKTRKSLKPKHKAMPGKPKTLASWCCWCCWCQAKELEIP